MSNPRPQLFLTEPTIIPRTLTEEEAKNLSSFNAEIAAREQYDAMIQITSESAALRLGIYKINVISKLLKIYSSLLNSISENLNSTSDFQISFKTRLPVLEMRLEKNIYCLRKSGGNR